MNTELAMSLVGIGAASISSFLTWLFGRKKEKADIDQTVINGMKESLAFYEKLSDDTKKRLDEVLKEKEDLRERMDLQSKEIQDLKNQVLKLSVSICYNLTCELRSYSKEKREEIHEELLGALNQDGFKESEDEKD